jgi:hypothetical protein
VTITSIKDGQEVQSVVVVDAFIWISDEVEVLINGDVLENYLPYYWNIEESIGEYIITVRIKSEGTWTKDSKTVVIPEEVIISKDYDFDEGFVVYKGQIVIFANGTWKMYKKEVHNGVNSNGLKNWYPILDY